ncbi:hypothetical protein DFH07DRAFT_966518 [Mycena maculata]|uniref:Uncharacterized protein n=1 Tax=Mycena maculata TaxID=230809 RepID=A0AAD7I8J9_9AGAR|nr:hypothetical protein DFH07DRAFT_966518 [Mycena maculata]
MSAKLILAAILAIFAIREAVTSQIIPQAPCTFFIPVKITLEAHYRGTNLLTENPDAEPTLYGETVVVDAVKELLRFNGLNMQLPKSPLWND